MPKSAVTVSTEYAQDSYAITAETNGEGTVSVLTAETKSSDKAKSGETVTVTVTLYILLCFYYRKNIWSKRV